MTMPLSIAEMTLNPQYIQHPGLVKTHFAAVWPGILTGAMTMPLSIAERRLNPQYIQHPGLVKTPDLVKTHFAAVWRGNGPHQLLNQAFLGKGILISIYQFLK